MHPHNALFLVLSTFAASTTAQSLTVTAATPLQVAAHAGNQSQTVTMPVGPLTQPTHQLRASVGVPFPTAVASIVTTLGADATSIGGEIQLAYLVFPGGAASTTVGDLVLHCNLPAPVACRVHLSLELSGTAGLAIPQMRVDLHDDGTFEFQEQTPGAISLPVVLGPTPTPIRVRLGGPTVTNGSLLATLRLDIRPDHTVVTTGFGECTPISYSVKPRFDGGVDCSAIGPIFNNPVFAAFGLSVQPNVLGSTTAGPCLLLPSPDAVLLMSPTAYTLQIPPGLRPIRIWTQTATPLGTFFGTSAPYHIHAQ